jgi:DNA (cytosine-5)-methyltransferase 1
MTGIDIQGRLSKLYPYTFIEGDALKLTVADLRKYDFIHLGGPCQPFSKMMNCQPAAVRARYIDLILPLRPKLVESGVPFVIENVEGAPLIDPTWLCGLMFDKELYRHRGFEGGNGVTIPKLHHPKHVKRASKAGHWEPGTVMSIAGNFAPVALGRELMGVTGRVPFTPRSDVAEAAPAYMTAYVAGHVASYLSQEAALWTKSDTRGRFWLPSWLTRTAPAGSAPWTRPRPAWSRRRRT